MAATLPTDDPSSMRLIFHRNVAKGLKKVPTHVEGTEYFLTFQFPQQCRQVMLALNFMLRAHRKGSKYFYVGNFAPNVYVNKLTSIDLTKYAIRNALNQLDALSLDGESQAGEVAGFLSQFVEFLTVPQLQARQEETFDDLVSRADIVSAEDDLFRLHTHDRYPLLKFDEIKSFLCETLFKGKTCDMA